MQLSTEDTKEAAFFYRCRATLSVVRRFVNKERLLFALKTKIAERMPSAVISSADGSVTMRRSFDISYHCDALPITNRLAIYSAFYLE